MARQALGECERREGERSFCRQRPWQEAVSGREACSHGRGWLFLAALGLAMRQHGEQLPQALPRLSAQGKVRACPYLTPRSLSEGPCRALQGLFFPWPSRLMSDKLPYRK